MKSIFKQISLDVSDLGYRDVIKVIDLKVTYHAETRKNNFCVHLFGEEVTVTVIDSIEVPESVRRDLDLLDEKQGVSHGFWEQHMQSVLHEKNLL